MADYDYMSRSSNHSLLSLFGTRAPAAASSEGAAGDAVAGAVAPIAGMAAAEAAMGGMGDGGDPFQVAPSGGEEEEGRRI